MPGPKPDPHSGIRSMVHDWLRSCDESELPAVMNIVGPRYAKLEFLSQDEAVQLVGRDVFERGIQTSQLRGIWTISGELKYRRSDVLRII